MKSVTAIILLFTMSVGIISAADRKNDYGLKASTRETSNALLSKGKLIQYTMTGAVGTLDAKIFYFRSEDDNKPIELTKSPSGIVAAVRIEHPDGITKEEAEAELPKLLPYLIAGQWAVVVKSEGQINEAKSAVAAKAKHTDEEPDEDCSGLTSPTFASDGKKWSMSFVASDINAATVAYKIEGTLAPFSIIRSNSSVLSHPGSLVLR